MSVSVKDSSVCEEGTVHSRGEKGKPCYTHKNKLNNRPQRWKKVFFFLEKSQCDFYEILLFWLCILPLVFTYYSRLNHPSFRKVRLAYW